MTIILLWLTLNVINILHCLIIPSHMKDDSGREVEVKQLFSLDGSIPPLQTLPQLLLLTDMRSLVIQLVHSQTITE